MSVCYIYYRDTVPES